MRHLFRKTHRLIKARRVEVYPSIVAPLVVVEIYQYHDQEDGGVECDFAFTPNAARDFAVIEAAEAVS
jgi:hypothetical protein